MSGDLGVREFCLHGCYRACMAQLTLRVDDALANDLRAAAAERGESLNALATKVLRAAVDPDAAASDVERYRERLRRMGLLADPPSEPAPRPDPDLVAEAARAATKGRMLSDLILEDRA